MSNIMAVLLDGVAQIEFDRTTPLPDHQSLYLDQMDQKMDQGILIGDQNITNPDANQRAQFVAGNLANAILTDNEAVAASMTSYLAIRIPELKQLKIIRAEDQINIDMVFDEDYKGQVEVKFMH